MPDSKRPNPNDIIEKLVKDPADVPDLRVLTGLLGRSSRPRHIRLYLTADLGEYLEIPEESVVHRESLQTEDRPIGGTAVWIRREAKVIRVRSASREAQADYLKGAISAQLHRRCPPSPGRLRPVQAIPVAGFQPWHPSSVPEFCDITILSYLGGGSVFCTEDSGCGVSWVAEC